MKQNELTHYGVIGMKWGVRRYQPYGKGGYTPRDKGPMSSHDLRKVNKSERKAYKARLKSSEHPESERLARKADRAEIKSLEKQQKAESKYLKKHPRAVARTMDDQTLKDAIDRKNKEKQFAELVKEERHDNNSALKTAVGTTALGAGLLLTAYSGGIAESTGLKYLGTTLTAFGAAGLTALATKGGQAAASSFLEQSLDPKVYNSVYKKK